MHAWRDEKKRLAGSRRALEMRSALIAAVRRYFLNRDYLEVETPVRIPAPIPEVHIDSEQSGDYFLRASPELHMKKLLAAGFPRLFQVGPCFRSKEFGAIHNPEYTMLEWYKSGAGYLDMICETEEFVGFVAVNAAGSLSVRFSGRAISLAPPWERICVRDAFIRHAGWDPVARFDPDRFDLDLVEKVEPALPKDRPVIMMDYPAPAASLARLKPGCPAVAERWELYVGGMELANAFGELNDGIELARRFTEWQQARRKRNACAYPVDQAFLAAVSDMPAAAGVALGIDRLLMVLADLPSLDHALPFSRPRV